MAEEREVWVALLRLLPLQISGYGWMDESAAVIFCHVNTPLTLSVTGTVALRADLLVMKMPMLDCARWKFSEPYMLHLSECLLLSMACDSQLSTETPWKVACNVF